MLLTSVRVSPCSCLCIFCSLGRAMTTVPFGPLTVTVEPSMVTSTPLGTGMGRRPIRDIAALPDVRQDFAAELGLASLRAGHDPLAGADDDDAEAPENSRDVGLAGIHAQPGLADALQPGYDRHLAVDVAQRHLDDLAGTRLLLKVTLRY